MKKSIAIFAMLLSVAAMAQQPFFNAQTAQTSDLAGSARYVGMGGALGALGADMSAMSNNPASTALMRKTNIQFTAGAVWMADNAASDIFSGRSATFDQAGIVTSINTGEGKLKNFNLGFNYQKKMNFNFTNRSEGQLSGLSHVNQVMAILNGNYGNDYLDVYGMGLNEMSIYDPNYAFGGLLQRANDNLPWHVADMPATEGNKVEQKMTGYIGGFDINLSANIEDRYYIGMNIGIDNVSITNNLLYTEYRSKYVGEKLYPYDHYTDVLQSWRGVGVNLKFGFLMRPIEDNALRIGFTIETPTWYKLTYAEDVILNTKFDRRNERFNPVRGEYQKYALDLYELDYNLRSPWKLRTSLGTTIGKFIAIGAEYEYAFYSGMGQSYPGRYGYTDVDINAMMSDFLKGQHTFKAGLELKPTQKFALRLGYNYISSIYSKDAYWDQTGSSPAVSYDLFGTSWMTYGATNIATMGIGYTFAQKFYVDLAYKYRLQDADFHPGLVVEQNNIVGELPVLPMNLDRHSIVCTLGIKF